VAGIDQKPSTLGKKRDINTGGPKGYPTEGKWGRKRDHPLRYKMKASLPREGKEKGLKEGCQGEKNTLQFQGKGFKKPSVKDRRSEKKKKIYAPSIAMQERRKGGD